MLSQCLLLLLSYPIALSNTVFMTLQTTSTVVGIISNITLSINRNIDIQGNTLSPFSISNTLNIKISFDEAFNFTTNTGIAQYPYSISQIQESIICELDASFYDQNNFSITILEVRNPIISGTSLGVYVQIINESLGVVDTASKTVIYQYQSLFADDIDFDFFNDVVETLSNLNLLIKVAFYDPTMYIQINILKNWMRQAHTNDIINGFTRCSSICQIVNGTTYYKFNFKDITPTFINNRYSFNITIYSIMTPPTLQQIDEVPIRIRQSMTDSAVFVSYQFYVYSLASSYVRNFSGECDTLVSEPLSFMVAFTTNRKMLPTDEIMIDLTNQSTLLSTTTPASIKLFYRSSYYSSYAFFISSSIEILTLNKIRIYNIASLDNYSNFNLSINGVIPSQSNRTVNAGTIKFYRNGYEYQYMDFYYHAIPRQIDGTITVDQSVAEVNTSWSAEFKPVSQILPGDTVILRFSPTIQVASCSAQCSSCVCTVQPHSSTNANYVVEVTGFSQIMSNLMMAGSVKNPLYSGEMILLELLDSEGYHKGTGNMIFPNITGNQIVYQLMSITMQNFQIFGLGKFTISYNLTNYNFRNGKIVTIFPKRMYIENVSIGSCLVNGVPGCKITQQYPLQFQIYVESSITYYEIEVNNIRNPKTTEKFYIIGKLYQSNGQFYDQFTSFQQQTNLLYVLESPTNFNYSTTNCTNSAQNNLTLFFHNFPFNFSTQSYDENDELILQVTNPRTGDVGQTVCKIRVGSQFVEDGMCQMLNRQL